MASLQISSNVVGDSNDENEFSQKILLTNTHDLRLRKTIANNFSANIKLSKTQLHQLVLSGGILARLSESLPKIELLLMNMWKDNNHFLTNPSFLLKFFDDAFQACLCLLSSHV